MILHWYDEFHKNRHKGMYTYKCIYVCAKLILLRENHLSSGEPTMYNVLLQMKLMFQRTSLIYSENFNETKYHSNKMLKLFLGAKIYINLVWQDVFNMFFSYFTFQPFTLDLIATLTTKWCNWWGKRESGGKVSPNSLALDGITGVLSLLPSSSSKQQPSVEISLSLGRCPRDGHPHAEFPSAGSTRPRMSSITTP